MVMKFQSEKLNKRHNGHEWFKWRVLIGKSDAKDNVGTSAAGNIMMTNPRLRFVEFVEARNFCWQTYGPSIELEIYGAVKNLTRDRIHNPHWAWRFGSHPIKDPEEGYIYLAGDKELEFFTLKFSNT
jgi:hypothetical protein